MNIPSKQAIVEVASTSGNRDKLYSYVANENDHMYMILSIKCTLFQKLCFWRRQTVIDVHVTANASVYW